MSIRILILSTGALFFAMLAGAQVMVVGKGPAAECYEAAKFNRSPSQGIRFCDDALRSGASLTPKNRAATYTNRGVMKMREGKYDSALSDFRVSKRIKPETGETWLNEGAAFIFKKQYTSAIPTLTRAIDLNTSQLHAAYYNRAIAKEESGDIQGAYADFKKADELLPNWSLVKQQLVRFTVVSG